MNSERLRTSAKGYSRPEDWRAKANETRGIHHFSIGEEQYGADIMAVREIRGWIESTLPPKQPDYVRGMLNLSGVMVRSSIYAAASGSADRSRPSRRDRPASRGAAGRSPGGRVLDILSYEVRWIQSVPRDRPFFAHRLPVRAGHHRGHHDRAGLSAPRTGARGRRSECRKNRTCARQGQA
jgi:CheW-like domain